MIATDSPTQTAVPKVALAPSFWNALRASWLFTWKSQLTLSKLPFSLLGLLALPVLLFLIIPTPESWVASHQLVIKSHLGYLNGFSKRLSYAQLSLSAEQKTQILAIAAEEYRRAKKSLGPINSLDADTNKLAQTARETHSAIKARVQPILDEKVFAEFVQFQKPKFTQSLVTSDNKDWNPANKLMEDIGLTRASPFYKLLLELYFFIMLPLGCVRMTGAVIRDELENDTLGFLTTRPLKRASLVVVKFLSHTAWLQIWMLLQTGLLLLVGAYRQIPNLAQLVPLFLGTQVLAVCAWSALGLFLGLLSKRYMPFALLYGGVIEMGIGRIPTNINTLSMIRHMKALLGHNAEIDAAYHWPDVSTAIPVLVLILAVPFFVSLAALLFTYKEYLHANEVQR